MELNKLHRRMYDGDAELDLNAQDEFVAEAVKLSLQAFRSVARLGSGHDQYQKVTVNFGRKARVYDPDSDVMKTPPFYLWCRCDCEVSDEALTADADALVALRRQANGLCLTTVI